MDILTKSVASALLAAGMLCSATALANEAAVQAAMDACSTGNRSEQEKYRCEVHVLAMQASMQAEEDGTDDVIHLDFDDSNDSAAQTSAKQEMYSNLQACEDSGERGAMKSCRLEAFHNYQEAIGN